MTKTIDILITSTGDIAIDAVHFTGADCERATAFLESALGRVQSRDRKPEYYRRHQRVRQQTQKLGA